MKRSEVTILLGVAAAFDRRDVGDLESPTNPYIEAWFIALETVTSLELAKRAVAEHYASTTEYLMPVHIADRVREMVFERQSRERAAQALVGPGDGHQVELAALMERAKNGEIGILGRRIPDAVASTAADKAAQHARAVANGWTDEFIQLRDDSQVVRCSHCFAPIGEVCEFDGEPLVDRPAHQARLVEAGLVEAPARPSREELLETLAALAASEVHGE